ncbi:hypothetical protein [Haloarchaeobius sp. HRN-SO-5]|uniref:hypothetical protein n=1 Tax=Haloarchaeobius sp. HRN-SO-5 TaxID=3446118 RepID=UPI003EBFC57F
MPTGYCTVDDVRRALRQEAVSGDIAQDRQIVLDAITAQTEWLEKTLHRHWYEPGGIQEDTDDLIPTGANTRDDEHDIPTHAGFVHGASERDHYRYRENSDALLEAGPRYERRRKHYEEPKREIRLAFGDVYDPETADETIPAYTRIRLARKDVETVNTLSVVNAQGGFDDWVATSDYTGGVGNTHRGEDYWVRVNNGGVSELYLNIHAMDDDIPSFANAVYVDFDYGHDGIPRNVRRAVAFRAASDLTEEAATQIPDNARVYNVDTLADQLREKATELLEVYQ